MDKARFENELKELAKEFRIPAGRGVERLEMSTKEAFNSQRRLQKTVDSLQESLDYLRVCIKYQSFDLEATRRENKYLKRLLEEREI